MKKVISFELNGNQMELEVESHWTLLYLLREHLEMSGTKSGCESGECGACTILLNGKAVNSCLILSGQIENSEIITVEYLAKNGKLNQLQQNFLKNGAVQCGFCTPGMLMSATALLLKNPTPTEEEIKDAIAGNLCRCTGYKQIIEAIQKTAK